MKILGKGKEKSNPLSLKSNTQWWSNEQVGDQRVRVDVLIALKVRSRILYMMQDLTGSQHYIVASN